MAETSVSSGLLEGGTSRKEFHRNSHSDSRAFEDSSGRIYQNKVNLHTAKTTPTQAVYNNSRREFS